MKTALVKRFRRLLGTWRGPAGLESGHGGIIQMHFAQLFEGRLVQLDASICDPETGETLSAGAGLFAMGEDGLLVEGLYAKRIGFSLMHETRDEPEVIAMTGELARGMSMNVSFRLEDGELMLTSQVKSSAVGMASPRTVARLKRMERDPLVRGDE